jgi:hypothetical protein
MPMQEKQIHTNSIQNGSFFSFEHKINSILHFGSYRVNKSIGILLMNCSRKLLNILSNNFKAMWLKD